MSPPASPDYELLNQSLHLWVGQASMYWLVNYVRGLWRALWSNDILLCVRIKLFPCNSRLSWETLKIY